MHEASLPVGDREWTDENGRWTAEAIARDILQWNEECDLGNQIDIYHPNHPEMLPEQQKDVVRELRRLTKLEAPKLLPELLIEAKIIGQKSIWKNADMHGWHNPPATLPEDLLLIHSEISEACEGYRQGKIHMCKPDGTVEFNGSVEEELADAVIRIFHVAEKNGIDICRAVFIKHQRNIARPFRHGNKVL